MGVRRGCTRYGGRCARGQIQGSLHSATSQTGRSCINFKKLEDLNLAEAIKLVKQAEKVGGINAVGES
jgi:hypothetical protein